MQKGVRRKGEIEFTEESNMLILVNRITKAPFRGIVEQSIMKSTATNLAVWSLQMADHTRKDLNMRGLIMRNLVVRGVKKRNLIDRGDTERSLTMMNLDTTAMMRR
jgi:hypothetical protein